MADAVVSSTSHVAAAHETQKTADGKEEIKYAFAFKKLDWDAYHQHRPVYPQSMWDMWFAYHSEHGGKFEVAHDIGAGPGTAARVLVLRFPTIHVSDAGHANLVSAQGYLPSTISPAADAPPVTFHFHHSPCEALSTVPDIVSSWLGAGDFACVCMAFHYMRPLVAVTSISALLKPGTGTFAAVTYSFRLRFPSHPRLDTLWLSVASTQTAGLIRSGILFPAAVKGISAAMSGLDSVPLPTEDRTVVGPDGVETLEPALFEPGSVRRVYINCGGTGPDDVWEGQDRPFAFIEEAEGVVSPAPSAAADGEQVVKIRDPAWRRQADAAWLRGFLTSSQMGFGEDTWKMEEWIELESIVAGAEGGEVTVEWPVSVILATRKSE